MSPRRIAPVILAILAIAGCKNVTQEPPPSEFVVAAYASPLVPSPNDVALASAPRIPAGPTTNAQKAFLQTFVNAGGFPSDQAVSITIPLVRYVWDGSSAYTMHPAVIDPTTITSRTFAVLRVDGGATPAWEIDAENSTTAADGKSWTLTIRRAVTTDAFGNAHRRWDTGRYVFALRGGASGVKTADGLPVSPDSAVALALKNVPLDNPQNVPIGTPADKMALLETVRKTMWLPLDWSAVNPGTGNVWYPAASATVTPAASAISTVFPASEMATFATFEIAPPTASTVPIDSGSGIAPLPIDLLRTGTAGADGQKTIAYNPAFEPAARGLMSLNGFSTTAMMLAQVSGAVPAVDATTVHGGNVHVFKLPADGGAPVLLKEFKWELAHIASGGDPAAAAYVAEPDAITTTVNCGAASRCSPMIGLQPAVKIPGSLLTLPPLDDESDYAVVITTGVKSVTGASLTKSTMTKILVDPGFDPIATSTGDTGIALLPGMPASKANATAIAIAKMRAQLGPVMAALPFGRTAADVVTAYTFRTQSVKGTSIRIAALPYTGSYGVTSDPDAVTTLTTAQAAAQYGVPAAAFYAQPEGIQPIQEIAEVKVQTVNLLLESRNSGVFDPLHPTTEVMTALVALPKPVHVATQPSCTDFTGATGAYAAAHVAHCAPLVIFEHGITKSKAHMLLLAANYVKAGFVVAAVDQMMQGERSYCSGSGADLAAAQAAADQMCCPAALCGTASTCTFKDNLSTPLVDVDAQGRPIHVGICETSPGVRGRMLDHRVDDPSGVTTTLSPKGLALASGNRLLTMNFFRIRDAFRQDVIDQSALVKALAPFGPGTDAFAKYVRDAYGYAVDWNRVYLVGHSGGAINATMSLAVNPRITHAVAYAPGATNIDVFANKDSYFHRVLLSVLPATVTEGSATYLKFLQLGKWMLDPAEPANYLRYIVPGGVLPSPFAGTALSAAYPSQPERSLLVQLSVCDNTVPNDQNLYYAGQAGAGAHVQWYSQSVGMTCPTDAVTHGNLIDFVTPSLTVKAQNYGAGFLSDPTNSAYQTTPVLP